MSFINIPILILHLETFCNEFFATFSVEERKSGSAHAKNAENKCIGIEQVFDAILDKLVINSEEDSKIDDDESYSFDSDSELSGIDSL